MNILGISSLDTDATAALVQDGKITFAAGEERFSRIKQHAGFPGKSIAYVLDQAGIGPDDVDAVTYPFFPWHRESWLIFRGLAGHNLRNLAKKDSLADKFFHLAYHGRFLQKATLNHRRFQKQLNDGLERLGLKDRLARIEHHDAHAAAAFYTSGLDEALIVTIDGYGSGLAGSVSVGSDEGIRRVHDVRFPDSLGVFYTQVTTALGFKPNRHEGKIVGLAAFGDAGVLFDRIYQKFSGSAKDFMYVSGMNSRLSQKLARSYSREDMAAAYQAVLERVVTDMVGAYAREYGQSNVVLAGGVAANVKLNQRIFELPEVSRIFIHPDMGDGGTAAGAALHYAALDDRGMKPYRINDVYLGPSFTDEQIRAELEKEGLPFRRYDEVEKEIAALIAQGKVVARFNGRMEYGPRALGNRSVLYHTRDPQVNDWLNKKLCRTEFMPFAPATLYEHCDECYVGTAGARHAATFMTITFDCTDFMKEVSPAAVHVDGTARPQLVREDINPSFYRIISEYHKLTGIPSIINTSFNMHEEPIVCTPAEAVRAFVQGGLDRLAIGSFIAGQSA